MAYDNIKILCQGFKWDDSVPLEKCNFFSGETYTAYTPEIDLLDFVVKGGLGKLKYKMDESENDSGSKSLFFVSGNIDLKLSGIKEINSQYPTLKEYFEITEDVSDRHTYKVKLLYNNVLLYQGSVYQDSLREPFNNTNESEIISCLITGFENEMKSNFSNINIINDESIYWNRLGETIDVRKFTEVFEQNFNNPFINSYEYEPDILEWDIARHPRFYNNSTVGFWHNRQGYERMKWNNKKWQWFITTVNSMGWIFFIYRDKFYLKNRSSYTAPLLNIDIADLISYEIGKRKPNETFDYLMLIDGAYYGGDGAFYGNPVINGERPFKGERPVILTNKVNLHLNTAHFTGVNGTAGDNYQLIFPGNYRFTKYKSEDDSLFNIYNIYKTGSGNNFGADSLSIEQNKILRLNGGGSGNEWWRVRLDEALDSAYDKAANFPPSMHYQLEFTGCAGSALVKRNPVNNNFLMQNYEMYVNSSRFRNNYAKYLDAKSTIFVNAKLSYIIDNPLVDFNFINSNEKLFDGTRFSLTGMEIDFENEYTELELLKIKI